jgi:hypothetical protein
MIFDDLNQPSRKSETAEPRRRRRRRRSSSGEESAGHRRRRSSSGSSFRDAARFQEQRRERSNGNAVAWLWVLGLLIAAVLGFAWYLHQERSGAPPLSGEAPSKLLMPFIDPILAPLETGATGYSADGLADLQKAFREERAKLNRDDQEIHGASATIAQILEEALADRDRHMQRLANLGSSVIGVSPDLSTRTDIGEAERKHLELAVGVSWQRNSVTYRNRVEELWYRLLRLERGRFREGSAPQSMIPSIPTAPPANE